MSRKKHDSTSNDSFMDYGYHLGMRIVYVDDDIDGESVSRAMKAIQIMDRMSAETITIVINSFGGSVYDGLALYDMIKACRSEIHTYGYGKIMSMATFLLLAGDKRYISKRATIMVHELSDWMEGQLQDLKVSLKESVRIQNILIDIYCQQTKKQNKKYWSELKRDTYFSPVQAERIGFVHEIIEEEEC